MHFSPFDKQNPAGIWPRIELCWNELFDLSKELHVFLTLCQTKQSWSLTKICLSTITARILLAMFILFLYFWLLLYSYTWYICTFQHPLPNPSPGPANWRWEQEGEVCCWQLHGPNCLPPQWDTYHHHCHSKHHLHRHHLNCLPPQWITYHHHRRGVRRHRHRHHHHHLIIINPKNTVLIVCPFNRNIIKRSSSSSWSLL